VEGSMLVGATVGFAVTAATGNVWLGVAAAIVGGALLSLIHAYLAITRRANQLASGLATIILALGVPALIGTPYVKASIEGLDRAPIPGLSSLPVLGQVLFSHDLLTYVAFLLAP